MNEKENIEAKFLIYKSVDLLLARRSQRLRRVGSMITFAKTFYLIMGLTLFFSCSQEKNRLSPKRTVIEGIVNNFSDTTSVLVMNYCNPLSDERQFAQNLTESDGYFHTEHEYVFAQNLTIRYANRFINLFVYPGDSIFIRIDANEINNNFDNAVTFSGKNSELDRELFLWTNYSYYSFNQNIPQFDDNASPEVFLASIKREFDKAQDSINAYSQKTNMSDFLKKWAYVDRKFVIANYLIDYYINHKNEETTWDIFTNPIFNVFDENNFQTMYFQYHLSVCMSALTLSNAEINRLLSKKEYISATRLTVEKLLKKAPKGVVRDVMLFDFLKNIINETPDLCDSIPEIKTVFSQDFFNKELKKVSEKNKRTEQTLKLTEAENQSKNILYLADNELKKLSDIKLLNYLSEKYQDKILYIDVWTTWCGPCLEEFKSAPNLHNYFKNKDVVFINLCLESNIDNWKPTIVKNNVSGENYFLDDNASKLFRAENNLSGYPSYLILDKKGVIYYPVPRPSNLESAIQKIELCLK